MVIYCVATAAASAGSRRPSRVVRFVGQMFIAGVIPGPDAGIVVGDDVLFGLEGRLSKDGARSWMGAVGRLSANASGDWRDPRPASALSADYLAATIVIAVTTTRRA